MVGEWCSKMVPPGLISLIIIFGSAEASLPRWPKGAIVNIAHRGGIVTGYPENTLAAFRRAIAVGAMVIEIDLRGTKDEEIIILHDETLNRTTNGKGRVTDYTLAELKNFDAGRGEKIPTYAEALNLVSNSGVKLLLDIKVDPKLNKHKIMQLTEKHAALSDVIVGVRNVSDLKEFRTLNPKLKTLGFVTTPFEIEKFTAAGADIIRLWSWWVFLYPQLVSKVQRLGKHVWITVGDAPANEIEKLIKMGVNGIISNQPEVLAEMMADKVTTRKNKKLKPNHGGDKP